MIKDKNDPSVRILELYNQNIPLHLTFIRKNYRELYNTAHRFYKGQNSFWKLAIENAGLNYHNIIKKEQTKWGKDLLCKKIRELYDSGVPLNYYYIKYSPNYAKYFWAAKRLYGKKQFWKLAIENAGLDYSKIRRYKERVEWTNEIIIKELQSIYPNGLYTRKALPINLSNAILYHFEKLEYALDAADIIYESRNDHILKIKKEPEINLSQGELEKGLNEFSWLIRTSAVEIFLECKDKKNTSLPIEDLEQEGFFGFRIAYSKSKSNLENEKYDKEHQIARFINYAKKFIRGRMLLANERYRNSIPKQSLDKLLESEPEDKRNLIDIIPPLDVI